MSFQEQKLLRDLAQEIINTKVRENDDEEPDACWRHASDWATRLLKISIGEYDNDPHITNTHK